MELTGPQMEDFSEALRSAFTTRKSLEQMLRYKCNRNLNEISEGPNLQDIVFDLIKEADDNGWTEGLLQGAFAAKPNNAKLRAFAHTINVGHEPSPQLSFDLVNLCFFDLSEQDKIYWNTIAPSLDVVATGRIIGFVVRYFDEPFLTNLCDRICRNSVAGQTHRIAWLTLDPDLNSVSFALASLRKHKALLSKKHLFCPVRAESVESALVEEFWQGVYAEFPGELQNNLLLLFTGKASRTFPSEIVEMPTPTFQFSHLYAWTQQLVQHLQWPPLLANRWSIRLFERSKDGEPPSLVIRWVYENLGADLEILRSNPAELRILLE